MGYGGKNWEGSERHGIEPQREGQGWEGELICVDGVFFTYLCWVLN